MTLDQFEAVVAAHPYRPKGIFYSEVFLFVRACLKAGVTLVIESGVGISTVLLGAVRKWPVIAVDRSKTAVHGRPPAGVQFVHGEAQAVFPYLLLRHDQQRIGVLIDGPKGEKATRLKDFCLTHKSVKVVAIHCPKRGGGETAHSHDPEWASHRVLDRFVPERFRDLYPDGPGLTLWERA